MIAGPTSRTYPRLILTDLLLDSLLRLPKKVKMQQELLWRPPHSLQLPGDTASEHAKAYRVPGHAIVQFRKYVLLALKTSDIWK